MISVWISNQYHNNKTTDTKDIIKHLLQQIRRFILLKVWVAIDKLQPQSSLHKLELMKFIRSLKTQNRITPILQELPSAKNRKIPLITLCKKTLPSIKINKPNMNMENKTNQNIYKNQQQQLQTILIGIIQHHNRIKKNNRKSHLLIPTGRHLITIPQFRKSRTKTTNNNSDRLIWVVNKVVELLSNNKAG